MISLASHWGSTFYLIALARTMWEDKTDGPFMAWASMMMDKDYGECVAIFINRFGDRVTIFDNDEECSAASGKLLLDKDTP